MKNLKDKFVAKVAGSSIGAALVATAGVALTHAQAISTSTVGASITGAGSDTGYLVTLGVGIAVTGTVALMGLGFGIKRIRKWITGGRF